MPKNLLNPYPLPGMALRMRWKNLVLPGKEPDAIGYFRQWFRRTEQPTSNYSQLITRQLAKETEKAIKRFDRAMGKYVRSRIKHHCADPTEVNDAQDELFELIAELRERKDAKDFRVWLLVSPGKGVWR